MMKFFSNRSNTKTKEDVGLLFFSQFMFQKKFQRPFTKRPDSDPDLHPNADAGPGTLTNADPNLQPCWLVKKQVLLTQVILCFHLDPGLDARKVQTPANVRSHQVVDELEAELPGVRLRYPQPQA